MKKNLLLGLIIFLLPCTLLAQPCVYPVGGTSSQITDWENDDCDGDGRTNLSDTDDDNDGILDIMEGDQNNPVNSDDDDMQNFLDTDSDEDNIPDAVEAHQDDDSHAKDPAEVLFNIAYAFGGNYTPTFDDQNGQPFESSEYISGQLPYFLRDSDNDGILNFVDYDPDGQNPYYIDEDGDGLIDLLDEDYTPSQTEFTPLSEAYITFSTQNPLPVSFISFSGLTQGGQTFLSWQTANEFNNAHFRIERSIDGKKFSSIGEVAGKGTTNQRSNYQYIDAKPFAGINYYRLRQVDANSKFSFSSVIAVRNQTEGTIAEVMPTIIDKSVTVKLNNPTSEDLLITVCDIRGAEVAKAVFAPGQLVINIGLPDLSPGLYLISGKGTTFTFTERIIKL